MAKTKSQKLKLTSIRDNPRVSITSEKITEHKTWSGLRLTIYDHLDFPTAPVTFMAWFGFLFSSPKKSSLGQSKCHRRNCRNRLNSGPGRAESGRAKSANQMPAKTAHLRPIDSIFIYLPTPISLALVYLDILENLLQLLPVAWHLPLSACCLLFVIKNQQTE